MEINTYLDATYLKTAQQANLSEEENEKIVVSLVEEAISNNYKLVMLRANYITLAKKIISDANSDVLIGAVIGFHEGTNSVNEKLSEATKAIVLGADELDFVINYEAFKKGDFEIIDQEVVEGTALCLKNKKVVKWIIEVATLTNEEIIVISQRIKNLVIKNFGKKNADKVFVKSSTGFFKTENDKPNGATFESMKLIIENAKPLKVKAAGGVRDLETAIKMIELGVDRIGTSSAKEILQNTQNKKSDY